jgi:hypothetical protein
MFQPLLSVTNVATFYPPFSTARTASDGIERTPKY